MISRLSCALVAIWATAGCGDKQRPPTTPPIPGDATDAGPGPIDAGVAVAPPVDPPRIAPHTTFIAAVAVDRTGTAAVSLDAIGAIRLWRTLDGTSPPVALPQHGARALEVARDGAGFTVGSVDGSGAAHLYHLDAAGAIVDVADVPAVPQAVGLVAGADGAWLVARADQSIALVDRGGAIVDEVSRDGTRLEALRPLGAGDAVAIVSRQEATGRAFAAVTLAVARGHVRWQRETPLAAAPVTPVELAVAPDGKHLAYFADPAAVKAAAAAAAAGPAASRPAPGAGAPKPRERRADMVAFAPQPVQPTQVAVAVVIDAATGADVTPHALAAQVLSGAQRLGFLSSDAVAAYSQSSGDVASALAADADLVVTTLGRNCPPALAGGHVIAGLGQNLVVSDDAGGTRYLGYQAIVAQTAALSPDGATAAWASASGEVQLSPVAGPEGDLVAKLDDTATTLEFIDATHVIAATSRGDLALIDATTARVLERVPSPGGSRAVVWDPVGRWLAGVRESGGAWVIKIDLARTPALGKPAVISDGSTALWFVDAATASEPALVTLDGASMLRTYTAAQLATGVPLNKVGAIPKHVLAASPMHVDRRGRVYVFDGRELTRFAGPTMDAPAVLLRADSLYLAAALPGDTTLIADAQGAVRAVRDDGGLAWTVNVGGVLLRQAVSADGRRALLLTQGGALVVDAATGAALDTTCGWRFGAWPTPPQVMNLGLPSLCE